MKPEAVEILGVRVDAVDYSQTLHMIETWIAQGGPHQVVTVNPEFVMLAQRHARFRRVLQEADLCVPDGAGVLWAARMLGRRLPQRVTGSDLVPLVAATAARQGWRLYFLGAAAGVADRAAAVLAGQHPGLQVTGVHSGSPSPEDAPTLVARIRAARPDVLFVAYGAPAQDLWIAAHGPDLAVPAMLGVGGAFDHVAGVRRRAPLWMQRVHLEWLFRLVTQPWRWRRQLALPRFAGQVLAQALRSRLPPPFRPRHDQ
jgi:N-acetylglucosaminyldiphosphoundecaprenol N-acetyl-beta-D-mannosaminyltransferase